MSQVKFDVDYYDAYIVLAGDKNYFILFLDKLFLNKQMVTINMAISFTAEVALKLCGSDRQEAMEHLSSQINTIYIPGKTKDQQGHGVITTSDSRGDYSYGSNNSGFRPGS